MGILDTYNKFLLRHPGKIIILGNTLVMTLFVISLLFKEVPSFKDPLVGFEARGTQISERLNTWRLILDETSASANNLSYVANLTNFDPSNSPSSPGVSNPLILSDDTTAEPPLVQMSTQDIHNKSHALRPSEIYDEDEEEYYKSINSTSALPDLMHYSLSSSQAFCGELMEGYAQVVLTPTLKQHSSGLFNINSILSICQLDQRLRLQNHRTDNSPFQQDCERFTSIESHRYATGSVCCNSWSLPNYIACLSNKTDCANLDNQDLRKFEQLLNICAPHYFIAPFQDCFITLPKEEPILDDSMEKQNLEHRLPTINATKSKPRAYCGQIPESCLRCDGWTYTVLRYLVNENFVRQKSPSHQPRNQSKRIDRITAQQSNLNGVIVDKLTATNVFLPVAKSGSLLRFYQTLSKQNLKTSSVQVKAMDLGLKNSLFEHLVSSDIKLFILALASILLVISIYTWSFILSFAILMIICLSLCLSYIIYELILDIPVFPFMNLLAVVISFGICSDNAMLFCKNWSHEKDASATGQNNDCNRIATLYQKDINPESSNLRRMIKKAVISTLCATLATAISFIISSMSKVVAVRCFCIFATLSVLTNYLLIVLLLPPALVIDSRLNVYLKSIITEKSSRYASIFETTSNCRGMLLALDTWIHRKLIFTLVTRFNLYLIITFVTFLACSSILVFYKPTLQPADDDDIQLLSRQHSFEQYDRHLKKQFAFERVKLNDINQLHMADNPETLPIRIVFGVLPTDNGNHLDPEDRGNIRFDPKFNLSDGNTQLWLLDFCHKLQQQRFVHQSNLPELSNCFFATFKDWMDTRPCEDPVQHFDRYPCCQTAEFPYKESTLNKCIGEAIHIMRKTPRYYTNINAGVRFMKNESRVAALIIESHSNRLPTESFGKMFRFYTETDEWVSWLVNNTAPPGLKSGWFISNNLELIAMQLELQQGTMSSILYEILFAMLALILSTRSVILTLTGTLTIGTIIIITVAILILMKWTLGVAESILVSLTIGLSIDFALHYTVAFNENRKIGLNREVVARILDEVGSPITLATMTTSMAGFVIHWSDILAYQELGTFLMLIAIVSWTTATFFLLPMLANFDTILQSSEAVARFVSGKILKISTNRS